MNYRKYYPLAAILFCGILASIAGCSKNDDKYEPISFPGMGEDGAITLYYSPNPISTTPSLVEIYGGTKPYKVNCESDILKVSIYEEAPFYFQYEALNVGSATVTVSDAKGEKVDVPVNIVYGSKVFKIASCEVEVVGDELTMAQHKELKEKALSTIPIENGGIYKLEYTANDSGILYVHKTANDSYRYEGTFKTIEQDGESTLSGYELKFDDNVHTLYLGTYFRECSRAESTPWALYEDVTEQFLPDYPGLEKLNTIQLLKY